MNSIAAASLATVNTEQASQLKNKKNDTNKASSAEKPHAESVKVTISFQAQGKLKQEQALKTTDNNAAEESQSKSAIDKLIDEIKEKIRKIQQEIAKLVAKGNEASLKQAEILRKELALLGAQLVELIGQKTAQEQKEAPSNQMP